MKTPSEFSTIQSLIFEKVFGVRLCSESDSPVSFLRPPPRHSSSSMPLSTTFRISSVFTSYSTMWRACIKCILVSVSGRLATNSLTMQRLVRADSPGRKRSTSFRPALSDSSIPSTIMKTCRGKSISCRECKAAFRSSYLQNGSFTVSLLIRFSAPDIGLEVAGKVSHFDSRSDRQ
jgi:hypothetical protein